MRVIVVAQRRVEHASLAFAAAEIFKPGDVVVLLHLAAVLPPSTTVLHSAPQTVFSVPGAADPAELIATVKRAVQSKVLKHAEALGVPARLHVKLEPTELSNRDAAASIAAGAQELGATMLVIARDEGGAGAEEPAGAEGGGEAEPGAGEPGAADPAATAARAIGSVVSEARAAARAAVQKAVGDVRTNLEKRAKGDLVFELLARTGPLPVVLVPPGYEPPPAAGAPAGAAGGEQEGA